MRLLTKLFGILMAINLVATSAFGEEGSVPVTAKEAMAMVEPLRLAIEDMAKEFPDQFPKADAHRAQLKKNESALKKLDPLDYESPEISAFLTFRRRVLLSNPLLNFDEMLVIKRVPIGDPRRAEGSDKGLGEFLGLPRQSSWQQDTIPDIDKWDNELAVMRVPRPDGSDAPLRTLYKPDQSLLVSDIDLSFDAREILFAMPGDNKCWQVFSMGIDGGTPRQVSPTSQPGIHNFDPIHLPNDQVIYISTAPLQGVPCNASVNTAMTYVMDRDGTNVRQLCFDQDHNYCPVVMNDGRIMYLRWEYTDIPHVWGRYLFTMNPDGSTQREFYGSGSYWPNSLFYARPIPNHPTKVVGIVTGHHVGRVGELYVFDPAQSHNGAEGVVQRIPGRGEKVEPLIQDKLTEFSWPKFLHPWPLNDKYFIVTAKAEPDSLWGIYLVDVFDNILLLKEEEGQALLEPVPIQARKRPPVIADRVDLTRKDAIIYLEDIYRGPGLKDVPREAVKKLRLFTYHFAYQRLAGISHRVGTDGPWEPKRVLGTVPVEKDGSAFFRVPANTPISIQPLDADGHALQLMRSWTTAMPGEVVSCVGCHERQSNSPPAAPSISARRAPSEIEPWRGPVRGFSFVNEVQPVLDRNCVGCHNGQSHGDQPMPDFRGDQNTWYVLKNSNPAGEMVTTENRTKLFKDYGGVFPASYAALRAYVRVGGFESDIRQQAPGEFNANTTELFQILKKGHYGVKLDAEAWDRLAVWIDLNAPCHGTWAEVAGVAKTEQNERRRQLRSVYGGAVDDPEILVIEREPIEFIEPVPPKIPQAEKVTVDGWPLGPEEAAQRQRQAAGALGVETERQIDLGEGVLLKMKLVPAGAFVMGSQFGMDERPEHPVQIAEPFWIGTFEVTNKQYRIFDPIHDSRYEHKGSWSFSEGHLGWLLNLSSQPVVRVSQQEAAAFAEWLSERTGEKFFLPTEAQWEYACRAGTATPLSYGFAGRTDFSPFANMADKTIRELAYDTDGRFCADLAPRDARFDDEALVTTMVGSYKPNAWGLHDMHGNAWEWTSSDYKPYAPNIARISGIRFEGIVARGGSWYDRPNRCRSSYRLPYPAWQKVFNVGFRIAAEAKPGADRKEVAKR